MDSCGQKEQSVNLECSIGELCITACADGLHSVNLTSPKVPTTQNLDFDQHWNKLAKENYSQPILATIAWFKSYFSINDPKNQELLQGKYPPLCRNLSLTEFQWKVYRTLADKVRFGSRISYAELATLTNNARAARAIGSAMRRNPFIIIIPCHRVVRQGGKVGNYGPGTPLKEFLLDYEKNNSKFSCI